MTLVPLLSALLATESFMLATISLVATLATPGRRRPAKLPWSPLVIGGVAASVVAVAAVGAVAAWWSTFVGGAVRPLPEVIVAGCLLFTALVQPVLAIVLALGLRVER